MTLSKILKTAALTAALATPLLGAAALAQPGDHVGERDGRHAARMARALDLQDYQVELLRADREGAREQRQQIRELRQQLNELVGSGNYSEGEARAIASQIGQLTTEQVLVTSRARHDFYQSLSEEQKSKLEEIESRRESRKQHGSRRQN